MPYSKPKHPKVGQYWIDLSPSLSGILSPWCKIDAVDEINDEVWISFTFNESMSHTSIPIRHLQRYHVPINKFFRKLYNLID